MSLPVQLIRRRFQLGLALALVSVAGVAAFLFWPHGRTPPPLVAATNYSGRPTACLAADSTDGPGLPLARSVWKAMQEASKGKAVNVQQLTVAAPNHEQAAPYLAGLLAQHCTLIITVSPSFTDALPGIAKASPTTQLTAATTTDHPAPKGVRTVTGSTDEQAAEIGLQVGSLT